MRPIPLFRYVRAATLLPLLAAAPTLSLAQGRYGAAIDSLRARLRADVAFDTVGGITAAVVVGNRMVWAEGFGWADRDRKVPAGVETIYRIGSISKTFTAVVLAQLVDRGVVKLDDPVEKYFPEVKGFANPRAGAKPITFRQLASHTAGLIREPTLQGAAAGPIAQWEDRILASIPTTSFDTLPGARYAYSNIGYGVLGLALSRAAKTPFMTLVERGIFTPLEMTHSTFVIDDRLRPALSVGYANSATRIDSTAPSREHLGRGYKVPNGGIYSTVGDLARFVAAFTGAVKPVLSDSIRRTMLSVQTRERPTSGYGLGLQLDVPADGSIHFASHGGSVAGYTAHVAFDVKTGIGVILLRNYQSGRTNLGGVATTTLRQLVSGR
jgi:CubicO group peptidase (beta-lactamase class C family)